MLSDITLKHDTRPDADTEIDCISAVLFAPLQLRRRRQVCCLPVTNDRTEVLTFKGSRVLPTVERFSNLPTFVIDF